MKSLNVNLDELYREVKDFAVNCVSPTVSERDISDLFMHDIWDRICEFGVTAHLISASTQRPTYETIATVMEALGHGAEDGGIAISLAAHACATAIPIKLGCNNEMQADFLRRLIAGKSIGASAITESDSGSDIYSLGCTATPFGSKYQLHGRKAYVTNAPLADKLLIYARTARNSGPFGISAFLVDRKTEGLTIQDGNSKTGLRGARWGTIILNECQVEADSLVGEIGGGAALFQEAMNCERVALTAATVGAMRGSLSRCVQFARQRKRFGSALVGFQAISHMLVEMHMRVEAASALLKETVRGCNSTNLSSRIAIAKIFSTDCALENGTCESQLFGADGSVFGSYGTMLLRNTLALKIAGGSDNVLKEIVARSLNEN